MDAQLEIRRHRWSRDDYHRLVDLGVLGKCDRVELVRGELIELAPVGLFTHRS